jgi:hypothetical protein
LLPCRPRSGAASRPSRAGPWHDDTVNRVMGRGELTAYVVVVALVVIGFCVAIPLAIALPAAGVPGLLLVAVTLGQQRRLRRRL